MDQQLRECGTTPVSIGFRGRTETGVCSLSQSMLHRIARLPDGQRNAYIRRLSPTLQRALHERIWAVIARPEQLPPDGDWRTWVLIAGRGFGKTRTGSEWMLDRRRQGLAGRGVLAGPTAADVRDVMVEGESGVLACARPDERPIYEPSKRRLTFPDGSKWLTVSADEPERFRGLNSDSMWADEPASWARAEMARDNMLLGLRSGPDPRSLWTGTPKPVPIVKQFVDDAKAGKGVVVTGGSTYENLGNLAPSFRDEIIERYEGTRLGRQELYGEILDFGGGRFSPAWFTDHMVDEPSATAGRITVRYWDLAATEESAANDDPDWTVGCRMSYDPTTKTWCVEDIRRTRSSPAEVEKLIVDTANLDGRSVVVWIEQEPGSSGKSLIAHYQRNVLAPLGVMCRGHKPTGPKDVRAQLFAAAAEQGRVSMVRNTWNAVYLDELESFPFGPHDDQVDASSGAFDVIGQPRGRVIV